MRTADYLAKLESAEAELLDLARALDEPVERDEFKLAVVALGQRARTLFRAFIVLHTSESPAAGRVLLRPMIEINTLIRFLPKDPDLHLELWEAEGDRTTLAMIEEHDARHSDRWPAPPVDQAEMADRRKRVEEARDRAIKAGIPGVGKTGTVMPGIRQQLDVIDETGAWEAYTFVYRPMSWEVHTNPRVFLAGDFAERNDGTLTTRSRTTLRNSCQLEACR